jgi:nucleoside-triphosphatase THEP1
MRRTNVLLLTGKTGTGKTMVLKRFLDELDPSGIRAGGILAPGRYLDSGEKEFSLELVPGDRNFPLSTRIENKDWQAIGGFYFNPETIEAGLRHLYDLARGDYHLYLLDEIGPFELEGLLWAPAIPDLLARGIPMIWTVRPGIIEKVKNKWDLAGPEIINIEEGELNNVLEKIRIWMNGYIQGLSWQAGKAPGWEKPRD